MVGVLGHVALAAVGLSNYTYYIVTALMAGLGMCSQIMTARRKGEEDIPGLAVPLNGTLLLGLSAAIPITWFLFYFIPDIFPYLSGEQEVISSGIPYLQARVVGIIGVVINFSYYGFLTGIGRTDLCLKVGLIMQVINVILNYGLIFGHFGLPELGSTGAGIGSTIATFLGSTLYTILVIRLARGNGFLRGLPKFGTLKAMWRLTVTSALTQFFFAAGIAALMWIVGRIGTQETAVATVLLNFTMLMILPCIGLGLATATLVGQALGRGDLEDAKKWGWDVTRLGMLFMGVAAIPMLMFPDLILSLFLHDPVTRTLARSALQLTGIMIIIDGFGLIMLHGLIGAGDTTRVMIVSVVLQWVLFLPLIYFLGPYGGYGLTAIWVALIGYRLINASIFGVLWKQGKWTSIKL
jgi:putative MATE family efflux protein